MPASSPLSLQNPLCYFEDVQLQVPSGGLPPRLKFRCLGEKHALCSSIQISLYSEIIFPLPLYLPFPHNHNLKNVSCGHNTEIRQGAAQSLLKERLCMLLFLLLPLLPLLSSSSFCLPKRLYQVGRFFSQVTFITSLNFKEPRLKVLKLGVVQHTILALRRLRQENHESEVSLVAEILSQMQTCPPPKPPTHTQSYKGIRKRKHQQNISKLPLN